MTSNRIRKHPAYNMGREHAEGFRPEPQAFLKHTSTDEGDRAYHAGKADREAELEAAAEQHRLETDDLSMLLVEAESERDFDKLCAVVRRLIEKVEE